jgi:hypothetical protein
MLTMLSMCSQTGFSVRLDEDHHEASSNVPLAAIIGLPSLGKNEKTISGVNLTKDPYILPQEDNGGQLIANMGCSKNLRKTIATKENAFDAASCKQLADSDPDCGDEAYSNGHNCICVMKGKTCDMVSIPGSTMFIPTTTLPPSHLRPAVVDPCLPPVVLGCNGPSGGTFTVPPAPMGDIAGPAYASGHTPSLDECLEKCCAAQVCEAVKWSPSGNGSRVSKKWLGKADNCKMYNNVSKYDSKLPQDSDFVVKGLQRNLNENSTTTTEKTKKRDMLDAWIARQAANKVKAAKEKAEAASARMDADAKAKEDKLAALQQQQGKQQQKPA